MRVTRKTIDNPESPVVSLRNYWYDEIKERLAADAARRGSIAVKAAV